MKETKSYKSQSKKEDTGQKKQLPPSVPEDEASDDLGSMGMAGVFVPLLQV